MATDNSCLHCGADCGRAPVISGADHFCCQGCSLVYQILHENKLTQYHHLEKTPGIKVEDLNYDSKYAYIGKIRT